MRSYAIQFWGELGDWTNISDIIKCILKCCHKFVYIRMMQYQGYGEYKWNTSETAKWVGKNKKKVKEILPESRNTQDKEQGFSKARTPKMLLSLASRKTEYATVIMIMYIPVEIPFILGLLFGKFLQQTFPKPWKVCNIIAQLFGFRECATERRKSNFQMPETTNYRHKQFGSSTQI